MSERIEVGMQAPDVVLGRGDGSSVALSSFWRERPAVVAFLRHFG
jgi:peroxiredoxin